ncbi:MAG: hypothetical protein B7Z75_05910 [Acidocella sp. 20-57-95]|nr:MAG: hypothetical protein B7Z75_05910 [Acidocella sp. 20-57-95]OYV58193.1 MAG: hypothetical protein B7Z71_10870 [Acidocella sp. 21-58-7]HQT65185.1 hypothetical protein [Acidocella sp.]HQU05297.1 hypothetical protein [Acidocella sp.]
MLKKFAHRIRLFLVGDILLELATIKAKLAAMEDLTSLAKQVEEALRAVELHLDELKHRAE